MPSEKSDGAGENFLSGADSPACVGCKIERQDAGHLTTAWRTAATFPRQSAPASASATT